VFKRGAGPILEAMLNSLDQRLGASEVQKRIYDFASDFKTFEVLFQRGYRIDCSGASSEERCPIVQVFRRLRGDDFVKTFKMWKAFGFDFSLADQQPKPVLVEIFKNSIYNYGAPKAFLALLDAWPHSALDLQKRFDFLVYIAEEFGKGRDFFDRPWGASELLYFLKVAQKLFDQGLLRESAEGCLPASFARDVHCRSRQTSYELEG
jgi:hypothetical protein